MNNPDQHFLNAVLNHDSSRILTIQNEQIVLRAGDGTQLKVLENKSGPCALFNHDGSQILTVPQYENKVNLWDGEGNHLATLKIDNSKDRRLVNRTAAFSPNGRRILIADRRPVQMWDNQGNLLKTLEDRVGYHDFACFNHDGTRILSQGINKLAYLWDGEGNCLSEFSATALKGVFSPDGSRILMYSNDSRSSLYDKEGTFLFSLSENEHLKKSMGGYNIYGSEEGAQSALFSPNGQTILTIGGSSILHVIKLWGIDGALIAVLEDRGFSSTESSPAVFNHNGRYILTAVWGGEIHLWDGFGKLLADVKPPFSEEKSGIPLFNHDSSRILIVREKRIEFWQFDPNSGEVSQEPVHLYQLADDW